MDIAEIAAVLGLSVKAEEWDHALELIDKVKNSAKSAGEAGKKAGEEGAEGWEKFGEMMETVNHLLETYLGYEGLKTIGEMTEQVVSQTMNLQHLSERYGVSIQQMQSFDYMAKLTGVSLTAVTGAVQRLEFGLHATSQRAGMRGAAGALQQLGINAAEFKKADMTGQLGMLADKFEKMADPNQKIAMAMQLGGRGLVDLIPLLSKGRGKIEELTEETKKLGATLDPEQAEAYEEQQAKLRLQWDGIKVQIVSLLLPALQKLGDWLSKVMSYFREHPEQLKHALVMIGVIAGTTSAALAVLGVRALFVKSGFGSLLGTLGPVVALITATVEAVRWANENFGRTPAILTAVTGAVLALAVALRQLRGGNSVLGSVAKKLLGLGGKKLLGGVAGAAEEGVVGEGAAAVGGGIAEGAGLLGGVTAAGAASVLLPLLVTAAAGYGIYRASEAYRPPEPVWDAQDAYLKKMGVTQGDVHITAPVEIHTEASAEDIKQAIGNHLEDQVRKAHQDMDDGEE